MENHTENIKKTELFDVTDQLLTYVIKNQELNIEKIKEFLDKGADVNGSTLLGKTILMHCLDNYDVAKYLLEKGADPDLIEKNGHSSLLMAITKNLPIISELINKTKDINQKFYIRSDIPENKVLDNALLAAIHYAPKYVEQILEKGATPDEQANNGILPIVYAIAYNPECVLPLLKYGANVNYQNTMQYPLFFAIQKNSIYLPDILKSSPDVNEKHGTRGSFECAITQSPETLPILLKHGVKVDLKALEESYRCSVHQPLNRANILKSIDLLVALKEQKEITDQLSDQPNVLPRTKIL